MDEYDITEAFEAIEQELIDSMIKNMARHRVEEINEEKQWTMWQAEQLKALELYKLENQKKYAKEFKNINGSIDTLIKQARATGNMNQEIDILRAIKNGFKVKRVKKSLDIDGDFFKMNTRKLEQLIKATKNDLKKAESAMLRMSNDQYRKVIFNAQMYANTGSGTYDKAIDMATKDYLSSGINCIEYSNGRRVNIASYAEMAIRTASKRAYLAGEGEKRQEWGISTVIVNQRGVACLKCLRFVGKVFIDDVWSGGKANDGEYPLLSTALADGLYHPNCKDSHTTYFEGITTLPDKMTTKQIEQAKQNYIWQQQQRYNERMVRKYSRLRDGSLSEEGKKYYAQKVKAWKAKNKALIDEHYALLRENPSRYKTRSLKSVDKKVDDSVKGGIMEVVNRNNLKVGKSVVSNEIINDILQNELKGIKMTKQPVYNSRIRSAGLTKGTLYPWGEVKSIESIQIGNQTKDTKECLIDTLLHEEIEARIMMRQTAMYKNLNNANDIDRHNYINKVIKRFFKGKGWDYDMV